MVSGIGAYYSPSPIRPVETHGGGGEVYVTHPVEGLGAAAKVALFKTPSSVISLAHLPGTTIREKLDWLKRQRRKGTSGLGAIDFKDVKVQAITLIALCALGYYLIGKTSKK